MLADWTIDQSWENYTEQDHATWRTLFQRQAEILKNRVVDVYYDGIETLAVAGDGIPHFGRLSDILSKKTGWTVVAVPGLIPDEVFFEHLANKRFPATNWIRNPEQMDYLQEPDVFHDIYGHIPLLVHQNFADYMESYGKAGLKANSQGDIHFLSRLYWYTVEFGLIETPQGLRIYGSGIVSSKTESIFCLENPSPNRIRFDLNRVMQTDYRIDDFQENYFVIDDFATLATILQRDLDGLYQEFHDKPTIPPGVILPTDKVINHGTGVYHRQKKT